MEDDFINKRISLTSGLLDNTDHRPSGSKKYDTTPANIAAFNTFFDDIGDPYDIETTYDVHNQNKVIIEDEESDTELYAPIAFDNNFPPPNVKLLSDIAYRGLDGSAFSFVISDWLGDIEEFVSLQTEASINSVGIRRARADSLDTDIKATLKLRKRKKKIILVPKLLAALGGAKRKEHIQASQQNRTIYPWDQHRFLIPLHNRLHHTRVQPIVRPRQVIPEKILKKRLHRVNQNLNQVYVLPMPVMSGNKGGLSTAPQFRGFDSIIPKVITAKPKVRKIKRHKELIPLSSVNSISRNASRTDRVPNRHYPTSSVLTDSTYGY